MDPMGQHDIVFSIRAVLLNGTARKFFKCKCGVRQGDPLSPLLFVLAAELLQIIINRAMIMGLIHKPLPQDGEDYLIVQYADDTLLFMQADARQLVFLKAILNSFSESTGLKINQNPICISSTFQQTR